VIANFSAALRDSLSEAHWHDYVKESLVVLYDSRAKLVNKVQIDIVQVLKRKEWVN